MPITILKFMLPEEQVELNLAQKGSNYYCALHDTANMLRKELTRENLSDNEYHLIERIRKEFYLILSDNNSHEDNL